MPLSPSNIVSLHPDGDLWQIKGSLSFTPTVITDTLPPCPVMGWTLPAGKRLLFTGGVVHSMVASIEYYRVVRRYFLFGNQQTAAPSAPAAPTTALLALTSGIGTGGAFTWKTAPVDTFGREGALSAASNPALTLTSTNRGATVTPAALGTGVVGYNIYRTKADAGVYYFVGYSLGASAYLDALPDASIDTALTPAVTWATGDVAGETVNGPVEVIIEQGAVVAGTPPANLVYVDTNGYRRSVLVAWPGATIGTRIRAKPFGEASNFVAIGVVAASANLWRGPVTSDIRSHLPFDYGVTQVVGANVAPASGCYIVWGEQVIGVGVRSADPVLGTVHSYQIFPTNPEGVIVPPLGEIVVEVGAIATGAAGVRDVTLSGLLIPTTG